MKRLVSILSLVIMFLIGCGASTNVGTTITTVSNSNRAEVTITWVDHTIGSLTHTVLRSATHGGPYIAIISNTSSTSFTDTMVKHNSVWYYVVTANNQWGISGYSNEVKATP